MGSGRDERCKRIVIKWKIEEKEETLEEGVEINGLIGIEYKTCTW